MVESARRQDDATACADTLWLTAALHHPTAEEIFQTVRAQIPRISLATVYKALEALVAIGVVTRLTVSEGTGSARYDARSENHYHFRCLRTGVVHDLPTRFDPDLISRLDPGLAQNLKEQGFQVTGYRLELVGYRDGGPAAELPAATHDGREPSPASRARPAGSDGTKT